MSTRVIRSSLDVLASTRPQFPEGLQVLLVESSRDQHTLQLLTELQYSVNRVEGVSAAVSALQCSSVDVILADISLVGDLTSQDGKALCTAACKVPLLLMGANCSSSQVLAAVEQGAADFLEKPLSQLKLRNIWQHTVRMMMHTCDIKNKRTHVPTAAEAAAEMMARHDAAADAAAAAAAAIAPSPAQGSHEQPEAQLGQPSVLHGPCPEDDCFKALELPPLMATRLNMDPEMIFLDLDTPVQPDEPSLDDILQPYTPSGSAAAAEEFSKEQMVTNCSSEQHGSGTTGVTFFPGELESCADTSSRMGGSAASPLGSRVPGLRAHVSMRSLAAASDWQQAVAQPAATAGTVLGTAHIVQQQQSMPAQGCPVYPAPPFGTWGSSWGSSWAAPTGVQGMVWGMPVFTVARAPGLAVPKPGKVHKDNKASCTGSTSASAASSPTHKGSMAVPAAMSAPVPGQYPPWMMPQMCSWPMMSMMGMPPPAAAAGAGSGGSQMQMFSGTYSGMMPPMMGAMGMPMMGMPGVPPMGIPGMWPAAAPLPAPAVPTPQQQPAAAAAATAMMRPVKVGPATRPAATPVHDVSTNSDEATGTAALGMWRQGSYGSNAVTTGDEFVSGLFVEEPRTAGRMEHLNTDTLFSNVC